MNDLQQKIPVKPKRLSVAAALAAGKFGGTAPSNGTQVIPSPPAPPDTTLLPEFAKPKTAALPSTPVDQDFNFLEDRKGTNNQDIIVQHENKSVSNSPATSISEIPEPFLNAGSPHDSSRRPPTELTSLKPILSNPIHRGTQDDEPISTAGKFGGVQTGVSSDTRVKNVPTPSRAGRQERGQSQAIRRNRTFRASDAEFDVLFDILEQVRRSRRLTRSQANRVETSTIIRAALRHVAKAPTDAILDEIIEREDFS